MKEVKEEIQKQIKLFEDEKERALETNDLTYVTYLYGKIDALKQLLKDVF